MSEQPRVSADGKFFWDGQAWKPMPAAPAAAAPVNRAPGLVILAGGIIIVIAPFFPWLSATAPFVGTISRSLMDGGGDGVILLVVGAAVAALGGFAAARGPQKWVGVLALIPLAISGLVSILDYSDVSGRVSNATAASDLIIASVGPGPFVAGFGIVIGAIGAVMALIAGPGGFRPEHPAQPPTEHPTGAEPPAAAPTT